MAPTDKPDQICLTHHWNLVPSPLPNYRRVSCPFPSPLDLLHKLANTFFTASPQPATPPKTTYPTAITMSRSFLGSIKGSIKDKLVRKNSTETNPSITRQRSMANPKNSNPFAGSAEPTRRPGKFTTLSFLDSAHQDRYRLISGEFISYVCREIIDHRLGTLFRDGNSISGKPKWLTGF